MHRSARTEASNHFAQALELVRTLPHTTTRINQELQLLIVMGAALTASKGYRDAEVELVYEEVRELLPQAEETPHG